MGKSNDKIDFADSKNEEKEVVDLNHEVFDEAIEWMCMTECQCSDDGNPMRASRWSPGASIFSKRRPGKHFVTRKEYDASRTDILESIRRSGGIVNSVITDQPLHVLKALDVEQKRVSLIKQARAY